MMGWRDYAKEVQGAGHNRHNRDDSPQNDAIVPNVPNVPGVLPLNPSRVLADWRKLIGALDPLGPQGMPVGRWQCLYDASQWWLNGFGEQAARDGWTTADIFGLWPDKPRWGGLIDRLGESRSLIMTADRASLRCGNHVEQFNRGAYPDLLPWWHVPR